MPLLKGFTKADCRENLRRLRKDGYKQAQAAAIAYSMVRKAAKDAGKRRPSWVKGPPKPKKGRKRPGTMRGAGGPQKKRGKRTATRLVTPKITRMVIKGRKKLAKKSR